MSTFYAEYPVTSGGSSGVSSLNGQTGALTLVAGSNITITPGSGTLTIDSTGGSGGGFTVFALTNDQETPANVTGLILDPLISSTYDIWIYTYYFTTGPGAVEGGRSGYYSFNYSAQAGTWSVISNAVAYSTDATISFNVTGGGQVQYTNSDVTNGGATGDTVGEYNLYWQIAAPSGGSGGGGLSNPLPNNVSLDGRNAADDADIEMIKVTDADLVQVGSATNADSNPHSNILIGQGASLNQITMNSKGTNNGIWMNVDFVNLADSITNSAPTGLRFWDYDNGNWQTIIAPQALTANTTLTLPDGVGTAGQVLSTNGSNPATLSWIDQTGGGGSPGGSDGNIQFNSSGSFAGDSIFNWAPNNSASHNQIQLGTPHNVPGFLGINTGGTDDAFFVAYGATSSEPAMVFKFNNGNATLQGTNGNFSGIGGLSLQPQGGDLLLGNASSIWPAADGDTGQILATDGNSNLSWQNNCLTQDTVSTNTGISTSRYKYLVDTTTGNVTVTLPAAVNGKEFVVKNAAGVNVVNVAATGGDTVEAAAATITAGQSRHFTYDVNTTTWYFI